MEQAYLNLLRDILDNGEDKMDRTGVGTRSVFGRILRHKLSDGFPLLTTKRVPFKAMVGELLWFIEGSGDERRLAEITFGTRDPEKKTIWSPNAEYTTGSKFKPKYVGDLGRVYGVQWRHWQHNIINYYGSSTVHPEGGETFYNASVTRGEVDQLANVINKLKTNPTDRRMIISAFNVGEMDEMSLPPCHILSQFHVNQSRNELNCLMYQRSVDCGLGLPFNIASYALLTHLIAQVTGLNPGELIMTLGDVHIYKNHLDAIEMQLTREPLPAPKLILNPDIKNIDEFKMNDISIKDYQCHDSIKMHMAV